MARLCDFIASDNAVSEGYCRHRLPKILDTLAVMMFGPKAIYVLAVENSATKTAAGLRPARRKRTNRNIRGNVLTLRIGTDILKVNRKGIETQRTPQGIGHLVGFWRSLR